MCSLNDSQALSCWIMPNGFPCLMSSSFMHHTHILFVVDDTCTSGGTRCVLYRFLCLASLVLLSLVLLFSLIKLSLTTQ